MSLSVDFYQITHVCRVSNLPIIQPRWHRVLRPMPRDHNGWRRKLALAVKHRRLLHWPAIWCDWPRPVNRPLPTNWREGRLWAALGVPLTGGQGEGSSVRVPSSPPTPIHHQIVRHMYILYTDTNGPLPKILLVPQHPRLPTLSTVRNPSKDLPSKCNFCGPCL